MSGKGNAVNCVCLFIACVWCIACDDPLGEERNKARFAAEREVTEQKAWNGLCHDESVLLATTAGSPDSFRCSNKNHRMRVQVASVASNEEAAALVFCECVRNEESIRDQ